jgi:hypothetical protein
MIIKTKTRKQGVKGLVNYLFKHEDREGKKQIVVKHNLTGSNRDRWIAQLEYNNSLRKIQRKESVSMHHTIISFSGKDTEHITTKVLKDIAKQFIELHGKDSMFLITEHRDKDHVHLHCAISGTKFLTGKANRMSKQEFQNLKVALEKYQRTKYPELKHSRVEFTRKVHDKVRLGSRETQKITLNAQINQAFKNAKTLPEFLSALEANGHKAYYRSAKLTGIQFEGNRKFRLSKLGIDTKKIQELMDRETTNQQKMEELSDLRNSSQSRNRDSASRERIPDEQEEENQSLELEMEEDDDLVR